VIKYNCIENGWSKRSAFLWGVVFPWVVALPLLYQPNALSNFINFSSLFFVSFTDFIVPWTLYIMMVRADGKWGGRKDSSALESVAEEDEEPGGGINDDSHHPHASETTSLLRPKKHRVLEHFAIPPSWNISAKTKTWVSGSMVIMMTALSIGGVVLTIQQNAVTAWVCWSVGGS
jgi:hypothetical protein